MQNVFLSKRINLYYLVLVLSLFGCFHLYFVIQQKNLSQMSLSGTPAKIKDATLSTMPRRPLVVHVSREHQMVAPYGGMASVVDSVSRFQVDSEILDAWVIIPKYSFIKGGEKITELQVRYKDKLVTVTVYKKLVRKVLVFLIGNGNEEPFDVVWDTIQSRLYRTPPQITSSAREGFFSVCVAKLLLQITYGQLEYVKNAPARKIDYVHIHGSTNGLVAPLLHQYMGSELRPSIIYTMHDYTSEAWSVITRYDVSAFQIQIDRADSQISAQSSDVLFISKIAILYSDVVTCVSKNMQRSIVSGEIKFPFRDQLMHRVRENGFIGIPNAVAPTLDKAKNKQLKSVGCHYVEGQSVLEFKKCSKKLLVSMQLFQWDDLDNTPLVLFIGRFEPNKGIDYLPLIASMTDELNFKLAVMGYHMNNPQWVEKIESLKGMNNVFVVDNKRDQEKYGVFLRAAADFIFVPSKEEGFGLVAAEGAHYGSIPIASNTGGLKDIVIPYKEPDENMWTGFLFDMNEETHNNIRATFELALGKYKEMQVNKKEAVIKRVMLSQLGWEDPDGPIRQYWQAYQHADDIRKDPAHFGHSKVVTYYGKNLVRNPSFNPVLYDKNLHIFESQTLDMRVYSTKFRIRDDQQTDWIPYFKGYELSPEGRTDTGIKLENIDAKDKRGASQTVILNQDKPRKVLISGWSKAEEISGQPDSSYGIVADISFMDRSSAWGFQTSFSTGTHDWEYRKMVLSFDKPIKHIVITCLLKDHTGTAYFDDISVLEIHETVIN